LIKCLEITVPDEFWAVLVLAQKLLMHNDMCNSSLIGKLV